MAITKISTNKKQTHWKYKVVVHVATMQLDTLGNPIKKHVYVGLFSTEKEAKKAEREYLENLENGKIEINKNATFYDVIMFFLDFAKKEGRYAKGTITNYECLLREHLVIFHKIPVSKLNPAIIRTWRKYAVDKRLSPYRINDCIKLLKAAFNYAISENLIKVNPFKDMKKERIPKKLRKRFSVSELNQLMNSCKNDMPEFFCIFMLSCLTGMRVGEYSALNVQDVDFENRLIYVDKQYTKGELKNRNKTDDSTRIVHPSDLTLRVIKWHMQTFNIKNGLLFPDSRGNPVSAKWVSRHFRRLLVSNDYPENFCRVHDLRGQYVDIQHAVGTPTEHISREVGHSRTATTSDIYTRILEEIPKEMNTRMDSLFNITQI